MGNRAARTATDVSSPGGSGLRSAGGDSVSGQSGGQHVERGVGYCPVIKQSRAQISVVVIVRNEPATLGSSLESVKWADEIVVPPDNVRPIGAALHDLYLRHANGGLALASGVYLDRFTRGDA